MLAVGEQMLGSLDDRTIMMTTGFSGGLGGTHDELCGALAGGVMLIGALHGRTRSDQDPSRCRGLAARYRERFLARFGTTKCIELWDRGYGPQGRESCSILVERAIPLLLQVLATACEAEGK